MGGDKSPYIAEKWAEVQNEGLMLTQIEHHPPKFTRKTWICCSQCDINCQCSSVCLSLSVCVCVCEEKKERKGEREGD